MNNKYVVDDIETLASCFTYSDIDINTEEVNQFVLHEDRFELHEFITYLKTLEGQITFNGLNFDYPIIHFIINNYGNWCLLQMSKSYIISEIYNEAQRIIEVQNQKVFTKSVSIPTKEVLIKQLDLFKLWHFNNKARSTSLKALEISMNYPNVMEMPFHHSRTNIRLDEIDSILEYNLNDVLATYEFYKKSLEKNIVRKDIKTKYGLECTNWNNGKIGEELILKLYCEKTGKNYWDIKKLRSPRNSINLKDCIPNNINFSSKEFNELLDFYKRSIVTETKGSISKDVIYKGIKYTYGTGGVHAAIRPGLYKSDKEYIIKSLDVASLYPNIPIVYGFYIEHLGKEFLEVYKNDIVDIRLAEKAKPKNIQNKAIIDGLKESANIPYGKSNDENSFLYDPLYCLKTTITGQLLISMICERLSNIPDSQMLMVNTDGCEIRIPRKYEILYNDICKQWELETRLVLEYTNYEKMWIADINNYGCLDFKGKIKNKGRFEVEKVIGSEPAYHKDNSFKIIPLAIQEYFVNNVLVEDTIRKHTNIYDFCGRQKFGHDSLGEIHSIKYDINSSPYDSIEIQQKNTRYYISTSGSRFIKRYKKGSSEVIHKDYKVTIFNKYIYKDIKDYNINFQYYIKEAYKEINQIESKQLNLF